MLREWTSEPSFSTARPASASAAEREGLSGVIALGRAFYDRPGPCAWLSGHQPPFLAAAPQPGLRGAGHAAFVLPVSGATTLVCDPMGARDDLVAADDAPQRRRRLAGARELARGERPLARAGRARGRDLLPGPGRGGALAQLPGLELRRSTRSSTGCGRSSRRASRRCSPAPRHAPTRRSRRRSTQLRAGASEREAAAAGTAAAATRGRRSRPLPARPLRRVERAGGPLASRPRPRARRGRSRDDRRDRGARRLRVRRRTDDRARRADAAHAASCSTRARLPRTRRAACRAGRHVRDVLAAAAAVYAERRPRGACARVRRTRDRRRDRRVAAPLRRLRGRRARRRDGVVRRAWRGDRRASAAHSSSTSCSSATGRLDSCVRHRHSAESPCASIPRMGLVPRARDHGSTHRLRTCADRGRQRARSPRCRSRAWPLLQARRERRDARAEERRGLLLDALARADRPAVQLSARRPAPATTCARPSGSSQVAGSPGPSGCCWLEIARDDRAPRRAARRSSRARTASRAAVPRISSACSA